jgi:hypothetical protein
MKLLQDAEWSPSEVRAEVERRIAAGEIIGGRRRRTVVK